MRRKLAFVILLTICGAGATALADEAGKLVYQRCAACHLPDRTGVPGAYPPLAGHIAEFAAVEPGRVYLVAAITRGVAGPMEVDGTTYRGVMPPQGTLKDQQVAAVLNFLIAEGEAEAFTVEEVAAIKEAHRTASPHEVRRLRDAIAEALEPR